MVALLVPQLFSQNLIAALCFQFQKPSTKFPPKASNAILREFEGEESMFSALLRMWTWSKVMKHQRYVQWQISPEILRLHLLLFSWSLPSIPGLLRLSWERGKVF